MWRTVRTHGTPPPLPKPRDWSEATVDRCSGRTLKHTPIQQELTVLLEEWTDRPRKWLLLCWLTTGPRRKDAMKNRKYFFLIMYFMDVPVETRGTHKGARKQSTLCCSHCVQRDGGRREKQKYPTVEEVVSHQRFILVLHVFFSASGLHIFDMNIPVQKWNISMPFWTFSRLWCCATLKISWEDKKKRNNSTFYASRVVQ